jgi:hypothetical protein
MDFLKDEINVFEFIVFHVLRDCLIKIEGGLLIANRAFLNLLSDAELEVSELFL